MSERGLFRPSGSGRWQESVLHRSGVPAPAPLRCDVLKSPLRSPLCEYMTMYLPGVGAQVLWLCLMPMLRGRGASRQSILPALLSLFAGCSPPSARGGTRWYCLHAALGAVPWSCCWRLTKAERLGRLFFSSQGTARPLLRSRAGTLPWITAGWVYEGVHLYRPLARVGMGVWRGVTGREGGTGGEVPSARCVATRRHVGCAAQGALLAELQ